MKTAIYARVSSEEQARPGHHSLQEQLAACENYCASKGYQVVDRYVDAGVSGTKSHRPELDRMLKGAGEKRFAIIVAYNVDRLARGIMPLARVWDITQPLGVRLEFVSERFDDSAYGEFSLEVRASFGKLERALIAERTSLGRLGRARDGKIPSGVRAYGYSYDAAAGTLRVCETEAGVVRHLFSWVDEGKSIANWVKLHNSLGTPTSSCCTRGWSRQQVLKMLKNPVYIGTFLWNTTRRKDGRYLGPRPQKDWVKIPVPAIVSPDVFERVQHRLQENKRTASRNTRTFYLLQHLLRCRECGLGFRCHSRHTTRGKTSGGVKTYRLKKPYRMYECRGMAQRPGRFNCRKPGTIRAEAIEGPVWETVAQAFQSPESLKALLGLRAGQARERQEELEGTLRQAEDHVRALDMETQRLITLARKGVITEAEMEPQLRTLREQRQHWQGEIAKSRGQLESLQMNNASLQQAEEFCNTIRSRLGVLAEEEKRQFLQVVLDVAWVDREGNIEIVGVIPAIADRSQDSSYVTCETPFP